MIKIYEKDYIYYTEDSTNSVEMTGRYKWGRVAEITEEKTEINTNDYCYELTPNKLIHTHSCSNSEECCILRNEDQVVFFNFLTSDFKSNYDSIDLQILYSTKENKFYTADELEENDIETYEEIQKWLEEKYGEN